MHTSPALSVLLLTGLFGGAAAAQEARDMRLAEAGFVMRVAKTAPEMERLKKLPARKMVARTIDGKRFFLYADPAICQCVMVGDQRALQTFRDLRLPGRQHPDVPPAGVVPENEMIADMDRDLGGDIEPNDILSAPF